jgi:hypothetical protein
MQRLLLITVIATLAAASPAAAQDPVQDAYGGSGVLGESGENTTGSGTPDATSPTPSSTSNLPSRTQSSTRNPPPPDTATRTRSLEPRPVSPRPGQQLPFTGFDISLLLLGGATLLALGFGLRRASRGLPV